VKLVRSSVVATTLDERSGTSTAVLATDGATLTAEDSTFADNPTNTFAVSHAGSSATLTRSAIVNTTADGTLGFALAVMASDGAALTFDTSVLAKSAGVALMAENPKTKVTMTSSLVTDALDAKGGQGVPGGQGGEAVGVIRGANVSLLGSTIEKSRAFAVLAGNEGTTVTLSKTLVRGTVADTRNQGGHAIVGEASSTVDVDHCYVSDNQLIGIGFSGATGLVSNTIVKRNAVGIQVQGGSALVQGDAAPASVTPLTVFVTSDTRFLANGSQVGGGEVPLPNVLQPTN
jgi:hypothetical protein